MGRCLRYALSLHFECAFVLEGVGVSSLCQVFPQLSLSPMGFNDKHSSVIFEFLVIFKARVIPLSPLSHVFVD
jgi:hypothetical protein